jgi:hypothetical protein
MYVRASTEKMDTLKQTCRRDESTNFRCRQGTKAEAEAERTQRIDLSWSIDASGWHVEEVGGELGGPLICPAHDVGCRHHLHALATEEAALSALPAPKGTGLEIDVLGHAFAVPPTYRYLHTASNTPVRSQCRMQLLEGAMMMVR